MEIPSWEKIDALNVVLSVIRHFLSDFFFTIFSFASLMFISNIFFLCIMYPCMKYFYQLQILYSRRPKATFYEIHVYFTCVH